MGGLAIVVLAATVSVLFAGTFDDSTFRRVGVVAGIVVNVLAIVLGNAWDLYRISRGEKEAEEAFGMDESPSTMILVGERGVGGVDGGEGKGFVDVELAS